MGNTSLSMSAGSAVIPGSKLTSRSSSLSVSIAGSSSNLTSLTTAFSSAVSSAISVSSCSSRGSTCAGSESLGCFLNLPNRFLNNPETTESDFSSSGAAFDGFFSFLAAGGAAGFSFCFFTVGAATTSDCSAIRLSQSSALSPEDASSVSVSSSSKDKSTGTASSAKADQSTTGAAGSSEIISSETSSTGTAERSIFCSQSTALSSEGADSVVCSSCCPQSSATSLPPSGTSFCSSTHLSQSLEPSKAS